MKIGFIGCGNMASAIISGIISSDVVKGGDINCYDVYAPACDDLKEKYGVNVFIDINPVCINSDVIFIAVKPNVLAEVLEGIENTNNKLFISIAAGKSLEFIEDNMNGNAKLVRVMPNINANVQEAISAYCTNSFVTDEDIKTVELLLNSFGKCIALDESYFGIFGVIGGCAPAFAYMFIDELARAAVKNGMKKSDALEIAAQTVYGSAKMIMQSDKHPWELIDNVCSPGGTTIEGIASLKADGFEKAIDNAVDKALEKDKRL